jgi:hypothetical protein
LIARPVCFCSQLEESAAKLRNLVNTASEAAASRCDSVLETMRTKDAAQTSARREERSRVDEAQRALRSELRDELLEQKKLTAGLETKQSNEWTETNRRVQQESTERKRELASLTSSVGERFKLAAAERGKLAEELGSDIDGAIDDMESALKAAQATLAAETERVHAQAEGRATLLEKDMEQVKTDLKSTLDGEVAGLRDSLQKVSAEHSAALEELQVQLQETVVTKLEGVEKKLESEISQNIMPLSDKVRSVQTCPVGPLFALTAVFVFVGILQVALSATKSELDITKTLMKMEMGELSQVRYNRHAT